MNDSVNDEKKMIGSIRQAAQLFKPANKFVIANQNSLKDNQIRASKDSEKEYKPSQIRDIFQSHHSLTSERDEESQESEGPKLESQPIYENEMVDHEAYGAPDHENLNERSVTSSQYCSESAVIM